jgi:hypothetical protein
MASPVLSGAARGRPELPGLLRAHLRQGPERQIPQFLGQTGTTAPSTSLETRLPSTSVRTVARRGRGSAARPQSESRGIRPGSLCPLSPGPDHHGWRDHTGRQSPARRGTPWLRGRRSSAGATTSWSRAATGRRRRRPSPPTPGTGSTLARRFPAVAAEVQRRLLGFTRHRTVVRRASDWSPFGRRSPVARPLRSTRRTS